MRNHLHLVTDDQDATAGDASLRPTSFDSYIGQREVVETLKTAVRAAKHGGWQVDHILMSGAPGLGKTSMAQVIANELGTHLVTTMAPAISHRGELASLLTSLGEGDVLLIDEIHRLAVPLQELLYAAMEDRKIELFTSKGGGAKAITMPLPAFTLIGATTHASMLTGPLRDRFGIVCQMRQYTLGDLSTIVWRSAGMLGVKIDVHAATEIARRSRGVPRIANKLLRRVRDAAMMAALNGAIVTSAGTSRRASQATVTVNEYIARNALNQLGIDTLGLDATDRGYLQALVSAGRALGVEALCATLGENRETLETVVEPFLIQLGLIARSARGRIATDAGRRHAEMTS